MNEVSAMPAKPSSPPRITQASIEAIILNRIVVIERFTKSVPLRCIFRLRAHKAFQENARNDGLISLLYTVLFYQLTTASSDRKHVYSSSIVSACFMPITAVQLPGVTYSGNEVRESD